MTFYFSFWLWFVLQRALMTQKLINSRPGCVFNTISIVKLIDWHRNKNAERFLSGTAPAWRQGSSVRQLWHRFALIYNIQRRCLCLIALSLWRKHLLALHNLRIYQDTVIIWSWTGIQNQNQHLPSWCLAAKDINLWASVLWCHNWRSLLICIFLMFGCLKVQDKWLARLIRRRWWLNTLQHGH